MEKPQMMLMLLQAASFALNMQYVVSFSQCTDASLAGNYNAVLKYNYIYLDYISVSVLQWMSQSESDSARLRLVVE